MAGRKWWTKVSQRVSQADVAWCRSQAPLRLRLEQLEDRAAVGTLLTNFFSLSPLGFLDGHLCDTPIDLGAGPACRLGSAARLSVLSADPGTDFLGIHSLRNGRDTEPPGLLGHAPSVTYAVPQSTPLGTTALDAGIFGILGDRPMPPSRSQAASSSESPSGGSVSDAPAPAPSATIPPVSQGSSMAAPGNARGPETDPSWFEPPPRSHAPGGTSSPDSLPPSVSSGNGVPLERESLPAANPSALVTPTITPASAPLPGALGSSSGGLQGTANDTGTLAPSGSHGGAHELACHFALGFDSWTVTESGGSAAGKGGAAIDGEDVILREGDSFVITMQRTFQVPDGPRVLQVAYTDLRFDAADSDSINDAFEVALVDLQGHSLVLPFATNRDAFFNATEDQPLALGAEARHDNGLITLDLAQVPPDTTATLMLRLVNNDQDVNTQVRILCVDLPDDPPAVTVALENDTAPDRPAGDPFRTDLLTNDPAVRGTVSDDLGISKLLAQVDDGAFQEITGSLASGQYRFDPGTLPPGPHRITIFALDTTGHVTDAALDFRVNEPPIANTGGDQRVDEGSTVFFDGSASFDTEAPLFAYRWTFHDGATVESVTTSRLYPQDGIFPVELSVIDTAGSVVADTIQVTVTNLPPEVQGIADKEAKEGDTVLFATGFLDPGVLDTHMATVDWGDGTIEPATVEEQGGAGTVSGSHIYRNDGIYRATVTVTDDGGAATSVSFVVTVRPSDATKFFVVDQSAHATFRYDEAGLALGQSDLGEKNSSPRGVASNRAGDTVWVVDANHRVYVYTAAGVLSGSWAAQGLNQPQDITTDGTDIWIVDDASDRVYRYAGAASRLEGTQAPAASFALNSNNRNPSGLVTDGTTLWVTDEHAQKDSVFVYNFAGTKLGSWLLDPANGAPSGITLNPAGGTELWVVDRHDAVVYHYAGATTRRNGSQAASDMFALDPNNHHPEGIADPPVTDPNDPRSWQGATVGTFAALLYGSDTLENRQRVVDNQLLDDGTFDITTAVFGATLLPTAWATGGGGSCIGQSLDSTGTGSYEYFCGASDLFTAANRIDDLWFQSSGQIGDTVFDLGVSAAQAAVFNTIDHGPLPGEAIESTVYLSNDRLTWTQAVVQRVWLEGFQPNRGILWDGFVYAVGTATGEPFRYASVIHGGPGALLDDGDDEINGLLGLNDDFAPVRPDPPTVRVTSPADGSALSPGPVLLSGQALADHLPVSDGRTPNAITVVTVNGLPVDALDGSGNFFAAVDLQLGTNVFEVVATDAYDQTATTTITLQGVQPAAGEIDFSQLSDISASFAADYSRTSFNERTDVLYADVAIRNLGQYPADVPLLVGVTNLSDPDVRVLDAAATTLDGIPYYDFTGLVTGGTLNPNSSTGNLSLAFANPDRVQFRYDLVFFGLLNRAPSVTSVPVVEASVGRSYLYDVNATDPDGDPLRFQLVSGPALMTIDETTGVLTWDPNAQDLGTHPLIVRVEDGRGGSAEQHFTILVIDPPPNRPPVFTSVPVVAANVNTPYVYDAEAVDPDGDVLGFDLATKPEGMTIDPSTGVVTWSPMAAQLGSHVVTLQVSDGRGGVASQEFLICVVQEPGNHVPVIVSSPVTSLGVPNTITFSDGEFNPADWETFVFTHGNGGSTSSTRVESGGNPGAYERIDHVINEAPPTDLSTIYTGRMRKGVVYDPRISGPVESISYSEDFRLLSGTGGGTEGQGSSLILRQNGALYFAAYSVTGLSMMWNHKLVAGLRAEDFVLLPNDLIPQQPPVAPHPDFSGQGMPIEFGFSRSNSNFIGGGSYTTSGAIDNWSVTVTPARPYSYDVEAVDADGDTLTYDLVRMPTGMVIDSTTGLIRWTPTASQVGLNEVVVRVEDSRGGFDQQSFVLNVATGTGEIRGTKFEDLNGNGTRELVPSGYFEDFENPADPLSEWSRTNTDVTPFGGRRFLGQFAKTDVTLTLDGLTTHEQTTVSFDLFIIRSWDGNGASGEDPDIWTLEVLGGPTLIQTTFANSSATAQAYPGNFPESSNPGRTGTVEQESLGFVYSSVLSGSFVWDSVYHLSFTFPHTSDVLQLRFASSGQTTNDILNEAWGLDNVRVEFGLPEPGIASWPIYLDQNRNGRPDSDERSTTTDAQGNYAFTDLAPDTYYVAEELERGWRQTAPPSGVTPVVLGSNEVVTGIDFGNTQTGDTTNHDPVFTTAAPTMATAGQLFRYSVGATDPDGDPLTFDLPAAPAGMTVHTTLGVLVWVPTADQVGAHDVVLRVQDGEGGVGLHTFRVTVASANTDPVITSTPPVGPASVGFPFQYQLAAQDADGDLLTFALGTTLTGLAIDPATGLITWTPGASQTGIQHLVVTVSDGRGGQAMQAFDIAVGDPGTNTAPVIQSTPRTNAWLGLSYGTLIEAVDDNGDPLTYSLPIKPAGMTIDGRGIILWQPTPGQVGTHDVQVRVDDGRSGMAVQDFQVTVSAEYANHAPVIASNPRTTAVVGRPYELDLRAIDDDGDPLTWILEEGPRGMSLDVNRGTLRWIPTADQLGSQEVVVRVEDPQMGASRQSFFVEVTCVNQPPQITSRPPTTGNVNELYIYAVRADDPEIDPLTFTLLASPNGMTIDAVTGLIRWTPDATQDGFHRVAIQVSDEAGNLATQAFDVAVTATPSNHPPVITSQPRFLATVGRDYFYQATATDADGDPLTFSLVNPPAGMTVDPDSGQVTWTPTDVEDVLVTLVASDPSGAQAFQSYLLQVQTNQPPEITSTPPTQVFAGATYRYDVRATDPNGDPLTYTVTGPSGMTIDGFGRLTWPTAAADTGTHSVTVVVTDDQGASAMQPFTIDVVPDTQAPMVTVFLSSNVVDLGATVLIKVIATDNVGVQSRTLTVAGQAAPLDANNEARLSTTVAGLFDIVATATDASGNIGTSVVQQLRVLDPTDSRVPIVQITSPADESTVTYLTPIRGTVDVPAGQTLEYYEVDYARTDAIDLNNLGADDPDWVQIVRVDGPTPVLDGVLATFDPTLLQNDGYVIRVVAFNTNGLGQVEGVRVNLAGNAKLGEFRLEFNDLELPLAGVPISVTRIYDTRQANQEGDFGFGWTLGVQDAQIRETVPPGPGSGLFSTGHPFIPGVTRVYLTNPSGERVGFTFDQEFAYGGLFSATYRPIFKPDPGVYDRLETDGFIQVGLFGFFDFNPDDYRLTTKDGLTYHYNQTAGLQKITDRNGNTVTFQPDGIFHSSGVSIQFVRDPRGRIKEILDPAGNKLVYSYDAAGDLRQFSDQANLTTQYAYLTNPAHFLETIVDPQGKRVLRAEFDTAGRLVATTDALNARATQNFDPSTLDLFGNSNS